MTELEKEVISKMPASHRVTLWFIKAMELLEFGKLLTSGDLLIADEMIKKLEANIENVSDKEENE